MRPGARRAQRDDPAWRVGAPTRIRQCATGRPVRAASAAASRSAWSNPRARRRSGCVGTGTRTTGGASSPGGALATTWAAITSATPSAARNFSACTSERAGPSKATGAHARATGEPAAGQRAPHGDGSPQRGQRAPRRKRTWARHAEHSGWPAVTVARQHQHEGGASAAPRAASTSRMRARSRSTQPCSPGERHVSTARLRQSCAVAADASWTFDPGAIALVGLATALYVPRWRRVRAQYGARGASYARLTAFAGGVLTLVAALISPIDRLGEQAFAMHMTQHILLLDIAPILFIVSLTKMILRPATRRLQRLEHAAGPLAHPVFAVVLYVAVMWTWHIPALYDAALSHPAIHALEHTFFMTAGVLYWWHLLSPIRSRYRLTGMGPVV